jgi:pimeloyl-ACP methyl ester carboxylesterase
MIAALVSQLASLRIIRRLLTAWLWWTILPTPIVGRELDSAKAKGYWFFLFHLVPDLPEALITGREDIWLRYYFSDWCFDPMTIHGEAFETYVKAYRAPGAIRGAMEDYRANASDVAQDNADASVKIACPVMSIWGRDFKLVGEMFDMPACGRRWQAISSLTPFQHAGISLMRRSLRRSIVS